VLAAETVSGLAAMLAPAEPWQGGVQPVPACDLDLAAEVELDPDVRPHPLALMAQGDPSAVLLTGSSGFLGAYLLQELLRQTEAEVHCLLRAASPSAGMERIRRRLQ